MLHTLSISYIYSIGVLSGDTMVHCGELCSILSYKADSRVSYVSL
jgi:hypothetical protein